MTKSDKLRVQLALLSLQILCLALSVMSIGMPITTLASVILCFPIIALNYKKKR